MFTATWNGNTITTEIEVNTNYTVSVETIAGYLACAPQSYQAGYQTKRNISFQYRALGAFVEAIDGTLYTASTWASSGKTANSVVLITSSYKIKISLNQINKPLGSNGKGAIENYVNTSYNTIALAKTDFNGKDNTDNIIKYNIYEGTNNTNYAAPYCKAFTFPNGSGNAYMPAGGQLNLMYQNKAVINDCLTVCGGDILISGNVYEYNWYHSSTFSVIDNVNSRFMWKVSMNDGTFDEQTGSGLDMPQRIRPIADYE